MTLDPTTAFMLGLQLGQWLAIYGIYQIAKVNRRRPQRRRKKTIWPYITTAARQVSGRQEA